MSTFHNGDPFVIVGHPADTEQNRIHAALEDIDMTWFAVPPVPSIKSECVLCHGTIWISNAGASTLAQMMLAGVQTFTSCMTCFMIAMRELKK